MSNNLTVDLFVDILKEYERQKELKAAGKFLFTCEDTPGLTPSQKCTVLFEEAGEVARAVLNLNKLTHDNLPDIAIVHLRTELIQVCAVCFAWLKGMET